MKKSILLTLSFLFMATIVNASNILVAYFSWSGNTQALAEEIQSQTNADIYAIEPATPYTTDYTELAYTVSLNEKNNDERPALKDTTLDLSGYDYIFVGCPVWWGDAPMLIHTFLEQYDFSGKTIIPFCTYATSTGQTLNDIINATPDSSHLDGFGTTGRHSYNSSTISSWLERIGISDVVAGIDGISTELKEQSKNIYTLNGQLVRSNGDITGLKAGMYIANGRKIIIK
jgi:flavodoxin